MLVIEAKLMPANRMEWLLRHKAGDLGACNNKMAVAGQYVRTCDAHDKSSIISNCEALRVCR